MGKLKGILGLSVLKARENSGKHSRRNIRGMWEHATFTTGEGGCHTFSGKAEREKKPLGGRFNKRERVKERARFADKKIVFSWNFKLFLNPGQKFGYPRVYEGRATTKSWQNIGKKRAHERYGD